MSSIGTFVYVKKASCRIHFIITLLVAETFLDTGASGKMIFTHELTR